MNLGVLLTAVLAAINDPELGTKLASRPADLADALGLDKSEAEGLAAIGADGIEVIIGSLIAPHLLPFPVGESLFIAPIGFDRSPQTQRKIIWLDQSREGTWIGSGGTSEVEGKIFGSGDHPTTSLCLLELESRLRKGDRVLDLGTGSGVVAIAAALLGAGPIDACDIDPFAVETARKNVAANHLQGQVSVTLDEVESLLVRVKPRTYDLIISNIIGPVHEANLHAGLGRLLRAGGRIILSGFGEKNIQALRDEFEAQGLELELVRRSGPWVAMTGRRP